MHNSSDDKNKERELILPSPLRLPLLSFALIVQDHSKHRLMLLLPTSPTFGHPALGQRQCQVKYPTFPPPATRCSSFFSLSSLESMITNGKRCVWCWNDISNEKKSQGDWSFPPLTLHACSSFALLLIFLQEYANVLLFADSKRWWSSPPKLLFKFQLVRLW